MISVKITVILINYKSEDIIHEVIESIVEKNIDISILILDNDSTQHSYKVLKNIENKAMNIKLITSNKNLGFEGGVNFAFTYLQSIQTKTDYIFLVNPDAILEKNIIYNLYTILSKNPKSAAISPIIFDANNALQYAGWTINWNNCTINMMRERDTVFQTDVFHGCAVLIDFNKFNEVDMFDNDVFMYYDEAFLSMKFAQHSYSILCTTKYKVYHRSSFSLGSASFLKSYYHARNHLFFFKENNKNSNIYCKYRYIIRNILSSLKHLHFKSCFGMISGIIDFLKNKKGQIKG